MNSTATEKRAALVPATLAVALLLFGSRWASYLGANPVFLTDILIGLAVVDFLVSRATRRESGTSAFGTVPRVLWVALGYVAVRFLASWTVSVDGLRDAAPYFYVVVGIVSAYALRDVTPAGRQKTAQVLIWALGLHAAWSAFALLLPNAAGRMPSLAPNAQVFSFRGDIDTALLGFFAALMLYRVLQTGRNFFVYSAAFLATWGLIFNSGSRAGLLSAVLVCGLAFLSSMRSQESTVDRKRLGLLLVPTVLLAAIVLLPQTSVGQRLAGALGYSTSEAAVAGAGTANARSTSWSVVYDYVQERPGVEAVGVGFGPDFMNDSGALVLLVGKTGAAEDGAPRSPHNYWLGSYARLGLIGLIVLLGVVAVGCTAAWRQLNRPVVRDDLGLIAALLTFGFLPVATLGVVLESPFGAVPWFWAIGVALAYPRRLALPLQHAGHRHRPHDRESGLRGVRAP